MNENFMLMSDSYKQSHWPQYPGNTTHIESFMESRPHATSTFNQTLFFGLQMPLMKYFTGQVVTMDKIDEAEEMCDMHFGIGGYFNRKGWEYILKEYGGMLPLEIKAIPEGTLMPKGNALITVVNTDPNVPFLTNFAETVLVQTWYPTTVATYSYQIKKVIDEYCKLTGCEISPFQLHDFGFRGVSSVETAGIGGLAHLVNFMGTDTMEALRYGREYYSCPMAGFSVAASEHSTMTSWGKENESKAYRNMLETYPTGIVSIVSDSYDIYNAVENIYCKELKDLILSRDGKLVVRPDSGDPQTVSVIVLNMLWNGFGGTINAAGYKVLNPKVGIIYGDGINITTIENILASIMSDGFAASNMVFGSGGGLLQSHNRDEHYFAFKCCARRDNTVGWVGVKKEPKTDPTKNSKSGRLKVIKNNGTYATIQYNPSYDYDNVLRTVYKNGRMVKTFTLDEVRQNVIDSEGYLNMRRAA